MKDAPLETVLLSLESGARPKGGVSADSGEIPSLGGEHVNADGGFDFTNIKRIPRSFFETMRGGRIAQSDILVVKDGATTGKTGIVREDFLFAEAAVNEHVFCVRVDQAKASPAYVYHFLRSSLGQKAIQLDFRGATVGGISREFATKTRLPLPSLAEQRRIAEVLDRAEALRAKRRSALGQLFSLTQSLFLDLFGDSATCAKRFPAARLGAVSAFIDYRGISPNKQPSGVRLVTARNIKRGWFEDEPKEFIPAEEYVEWMRRGMPRTGDVLFTTEGHTLGSAAQLPHFEKAALAQRLIALQPGEKLRPEYLLQVILGRGFQNEVFRRATGSAARGISSKQLAEILVAIPPIELQREFALRVTAVEKLKIAQRASLTELDALFASLQYRAFRGDL